jgi:hypothetical protein
MSEILNQKAPISVTNPELAEKIKQEEQKKYAEMRRKANLTLLAKASIVPIGLYAFSKYNKYDNKKTIKVTIIGSVVILGAVWINGMSGMWSGVTIADTIFGKTKKSKSIDLPKVAQTPIEPAKPLPIQNTPNNNKPCKKWVQSTCITAPCPPTCVEY